MRFKVGDKVRVREDLKVGEFYGNNEFFTKEMSQFKGKEAEIKEVDSCFYDLDIDNGTYAWTDEMLEPAEEVETYEMYIDRISPHKPKQPEQVLKEQVQQIAEESERNCDTCKHDNTYYDCSQCSDFDEWRKKPYLGKTYAKDYPKTAKFQILQEEELEMYKLKNDKYGDSFGISVQKYGLISALTRMSDKWNRIENLILNHDSGTDDESLIDSLKDLSNYANMTIIELEDMND